MYGWNEAHRVKAMAEAEEVARRVRALQGKGLVATGEAAVSFGGGEGGGGAAEGGEGGRLGGRDPHRTLQVRERD